MKTIIIAIAVAGLVTTSAQAAWKLDSENSNISFVSTKAINAAEVHRFGEMSGGIDDMGNASVSISLESVDTAIELRDERMREMLFETEQYSSASVSVAVDGNAVAAMEPGSSTRMTVEGEISLHGIDRVIPMDVIVVRSGDHSLVVSSAQPIIVNASQFRLVEGIQKLTEIAGLPNISMAVPVSFVLAFTEE
jgi:polyisoprenoid-binding protein YceI